MSSNTKLNIAIRAEGGGGDYLLANKLVNILKHSYPYSNFNLFCDSDGNDGPSKIISKYFGHLYNSIAICEPRKNKEYLVNTQWGRENLPAIIDNLSDNDLNKIKDNNDIFIDCWIDGLNWIDHIPDWPRYFHEWPEIDVGRSGLEMDECLRIFDMTKEPYIICHPMSRPESNHKMGEEWYVQKLLKDLSNKFKVIVIAEDKYVELSLYKNAAAIPNVRVEVLNFDEIILLSAQKNLVSFIGVDSSPRYIPKHFNKPSFVYSQYCSAPGVAAKSHIIRWLVDEQFVIPMNHNTKEVVNAINNVKENPAAWFWPWLDDLDSRLIKRNL